MCHIVAVLLWFLAWLLFIHLKPVLCVIPHTCLPCISQLSELNDLTCKPVWINLALCSTIPLCRAVMLTCSTCDMLSCSSLPLNAWWQTVISIHTHTEHATVWALLFHLDGGIQLLSVLTLWFYVHNAVPVISEGSKREQGHFRMLLCAFEPHYVDVMFSSSGTD